MSNDQIWAPWRLGYIVSGKKEAGPDCFLCEGLAAADDRKSLIVLRSPHALAMLNRFPYNNGHLLVAPTAHKAAMADLCDEELLGCMKAICRMMEVLDETIRPEGYNVGINLGRVAGAGLPGHLHWHVVPRWQGDTNFMPTLAGVNVIPQSLEALYDELAARL